MSPDFIFETSWEVCNKVGGIYTVLSTRAKTLQSMMLDKVLFIGPDVWLEKKNPLFEEDFTLLNDWKTALQGANLKVRIGRWQIPGFPIAILVDFRDFFEEKNAIYAEAWSDFKVDSLHGYGDYDEASMFSYAAGRVAKEICEKFLRNQKVVYQAHEWMSGLGMLYIKKHLPWVATIFTTHATSIGRSIAGNDKPLYDYFDGYNGDQMARELNMESKHSIEKQSAIHADCFSTVSEITNRECAQLLEKPADAILMNGFETDFLPRGRAFPMKRKKAREQMLNVANCLMGNSLDDDTLIISLSGRNDFRCKGIDVFVEALARLNKRGDLSRNVLALIEVPCWMKEARKDLSERLGEKKRFETPLDTPIITHQLHNMDDDRILNLIKSHHLWNKPNDRVKVILVPCYLDGNDGIFNTPYYDLLIGNDLCVYPSYYEPWGYTPLESAAFKIPCITTNLSGFGLWVNQLKKHEGTLEDGVRVIPRTDINYFEVADEIVNTILRFSQMTNDEVVRIRQNVGKIAEKALWKHFIKYYNVAYDIALQKMMMRIATNEKNV